MDKVYLGIDVGSKIIKGVVMDNNYNIIIKKYLYIDKLSINKAKKLISILSNETKKLGLKIVSIGITGVGRRLIGKRIGADVIKNEIECNAIGINYINSNIRTIVDVGYDNLKIIKLNKGIVSDYNIYDIYNLDCKDEEDIINKTSISLINILRNNKLVEPISLHGGFSKNKRFVIDLKRLVKKNIYIDKDSLYIGAFGVAILTKNTKLEKEINWDNILSKFGVLNEKDTI